MAALRHFLTFQQYSREEILSLLDRSREMKTQIRKKGAPRPLEGRVVGMIFEKPSTRTRVSFEVGVHQLGGHAVFLSPRDIQIGRGEPIRDTARVLSRYLDALVIRCYGHEVLEEFVKWSSVPVVNGLSDLHHPCQILGDLLTLQEVGLDICSMKASWVGDGNNVANSWIDAALKLGFSLRLACPEGYYPQIAFDSSDISLMRDPVQAIADCDVVSTDVWASMGQEDEVDVRQKVFKKYQVNFELLKHAADPAYILHCLPAHRGEEITDEVMESRNSLVWEQAENRLHAQKAILEMLLNGL